MKVIVLVEDENLICVGQKADIGKVNKLSTEKESNNVAKDIKEIERFAKCRAIKTVLTNLLNLPETTDDYKEVDPDVFDQYVQMSHCIDVCFDNLINERFDSCDDCECDCEHCECDCEGCACDIEDDCEEVDEENDDDINDQMIADLVSLLIKFDGVFDKENVEENSTINITMSGDEYNSIKEIFDRYSTEELQ